MPVTTPKADEPVDAGLLRFLPPAKDDFGGKDFLECEALDGLAVELIERFEELRFIEEYRLQVLWKRQGGSRGGRSRLGKCNKPSGLSLFYSEKDWVIWLAADHAVSYRLNVRQIEALVYHEMLHCAIETDDAGVVKATTVGHDLEVFNKEIERYGLCREDLETTAQAMGRQLSLRLDGEAP